MFWKKSPALFTRRYTIETSAVDDSALRRMEYLQVLENAVIMHDNHARSLEEQKAMQQKLQKTVVNLDDRAGVTVTELQETVDELKDLVQSTDWKKDLKDQKEKNAPLFKEIQESFAQFKLQMEEV